MKRPNDPGPFDIIGDDHTSLSEQQAEGVVSINDARPHVLGSGDRFDLLERPPLCDDKGKKGR